MSLPSGDLLPGRLFIGLLRQIDQHGDPGTSPHFSISHKALLPLKAENRGIGRLPSPIDLTTVGPNGSQTDLKAFEGGFHMRVIWRAVRVYRQSLCQLGRNYLAAVPDCLTVIPQMPDFQNHIFRATAQAFRQIGNWDSLAFEFVEFSLELVVSLGKHSIAIPPVNWRCGGSQTGDLPGFYVHLPFLQVQKEVSVRTQGEYAHEPDCKQEDRKIGPFWPDVGYLFLHTCLLHPGQHGRAK